MASSRGGYLLFAARLLTTFLTAAAIAVADDNPQLSSPFISRVVVADDDIHRSPSPFVLIRRDAYAHEFTSVFPRDIPHDGFASIASSPPPAVPIDELELSCYSSNGTSSYQVTLTPEYALQIFARLDSWTCSFKWEAADRYQSFHVYGLHGFKLPFSCPLEMCWWTFDTEGFNLLDHTANFAHIYDWTEGQPQARLIDPNLI